VSETRAELGDTVEVADDAQRWLSDSDKNKTKSYSYSQMQSHIVYGLECKRNI
jgi:hypothetical protein